MSLSENVEHNDGWFPISKAELKAMTSQTAHQTLDILVKAVRNDVPPQ